MDYCEETYSVQSQYSIDFESKTETSNKGKQKVKQYSKTTPNTPILPKTTAKHLQTPEQRTKDFQSPRNPTQQQKPISTSTNIIEYLQEIGSNHSENLEKETTENKEEMATTYIAKIPKFTGEDNDTSPQEWLVKVQKTGDANEPFENWQAFKDAFLQQFIDNNTSITFHNHFHNIKQETSKTILDQFIAELKDKLIKKVCLHAPTDLVTVIRHAKNYEIAMEEANHTKLTNSQRKLKATLQTNNNSNNNHKDINPHKDTIKTILDHHPTTNLKIVIIVEFQNTGNEIVGNCKETSKTEVINITFHHNNFITNLHHQYITHQDHKIKTITINQLYNQCNNNISNLYQFSNIKHHPPNNIKITTIEPTQITSWFSEILASKDPTTTTLNPVILQCEVAAPKLNPSNYTIPLAQIVQNANLLDIFLFEFEANESPFLLSNTAVNEQKAIMVMYTKATVEGKPIQLILDSGSTGSIITYQLMQQLQKTIDRPAQTIIVTADVPATCGTFNKRSEKAPVFEFKEEKEMPLIETYMALGLTSNWAEETEQKIFEGSRGWRKVRYSTPEPQKQPPYISLKCKDCNKKLLLIEACISPEEKYETRTCYYCKACHRKRFEHPKRSGKWDNTSCLTCRDMLPEEYNWIDVAMRGGVFRRETPFDAAYNSALNKLYHYPHDTEMIFDLAITLINRATQKDVRQMKEAEYIKYIIELAGFDYENKVETYHQIASHTYSTQEAQIQQLE
ncbi:hypothetical protein G9A89_018762 [Geosiphon pyriformis]|nr:hypothetical protein G9A89_018762 [Geosiphon pyriformis]